MQRMSEMRRLLKTLRVVGFFFSQAIYRDQGKMVLIDTSVERRLGKAFFPPCRAADAQEAATTCKNSARHEKKQQKTTGPLGILLPTRALPARPAGDEGFPSLEKLRLKKKPN